MKPTLPLKIGHTYRTNRGDTFTLTKSEEAHGTSLWAPEIGLYFNPDKLFAPATSCEIVEELSPKPSSLSHKEMMQRLEALELRVGDLEYE